MSDSHTHPHGYRRVARLLLPERCTGERPGPCRADIDPHLPWRSVWTIARSVPQWHYRREGTFLLGSHGCHPSMTGLEDVLMPSGWLQWVPRPVSPPLDGGHPPSSRSAAVTVGRHSFSSNTLGANGACEESSRDSSSASVFSLRGTCHSSSPSKCRSMRLTSSTYAAI